MGCVVEFESKKIDELSKIEHKYEPEERTIHGLKVKDIIYNIVDHNSIVAIWQDDHEDTHYANRLWRGMAHSIPEEIGNLRFKRIFGLMSESIYDSDIVNIDTYWN